MTFQPVVPFGGLAGWAFLTRTMDAQKAAFDRSAVIERNAAYFSERISGISSAEELVADRRLLTVALGAFGLQDDIGNTFFIRKVLEEGTLDDQSLANRLSDKRYLALSRAFGFGDVDPPFTKLSDFAPKIVAAYRSGGFEAALGNVNPDMRLALGLEREISQVFDRVEGDRALWFTVLATPPLRTVFERALGLPDVTATLDLDRQLRMFEERAERAFGDDSVRQFRDPEKLSELRELFLVRSEQGVSGGWAVRGAAALALLQASGPAPAPLR